MRIIKDREGILQLKATEFDISAYSFIHVSPSQLAQSSKSESMPPQQVDVNGAGNSAAHSPITETAKESNFLQYKIAKQQRQLTTLQKSVKEQQEKKNQAKEHLTHTMSAGGIREQRQLR
ncbi:hypothetical protein PoB_002129800 [Plakobranchus ocellatus]|uniref:Uncharacterized protein n=1 Tax=Plakobranchus ocellatus TaxID=259542 RepID=A0AAV3ZJY9_9GAST|nr:hypothetical protein PoB_002129800 [Plakobranchus ocellatus]